MKTKRIIFRRCKLYKRYGYDVYVARGEDWTYGYIVKHHHIGYFELGLGAMTSTQYISPT